MAVLKLPRMPDGAAIVDTKNGKPITALTRAWDAAMSQIEDNLNGILAAQDAADAAQSDADAAMAAAIAAQADADAALAAAIAAQATADAAKATADALDAALNVTAGKVLTVLNTMTLAAIDGSTLNIGTGGTLGTAAYTNASDYLPSGSSGAFLTKVNNLSDVASVPLARTNLGVTATGADTTYAFRSNNLSDLGSATTARGNLGLGTAATQNTGTSGATVPLLNGANTWASTQVFTGNVGIGTAPSTDFHVSGAGGASFYNAVIAAQSTDNPKIGLYAQNAGFQWSTRIATTGTPNNGEWVLRYESGGTDTIVVGRSGHVLIGTAIDSGAYLLQVNSQIFATNATIATSDARVKREMPKLTADQMAKISDIPVRIYERTDRPQDGSRAGYFAQDWQSILGLKTGIVRQQTDDAMLQLDEGAAHALKIAALEHRVEVLETKNYEAGLA